MSGDRLLSSWSLSQSGVADAPTVGAKAAGLLPLPAAWYPPFVVLTALFCAEWRTTRRADLVMLRLSHGEQTALKQLLERASKDPLGPSRVIVRSNGSAEFGMHQRGRFKSRTSAVDMKELARAIDALLGQPDAPDLLMIQPLVAPCFPGHMSNERRVTDDRRSWLVEYDEGHTLRQERIRAQGTPPGAQTLAAHDVSAAMRALRSVAAVVQPLARELHVEWLWDARSVWVVQVDDVSSSESPDTSRADTYLASSQSAPATSARPSVLRWVGPDDERRWAKLGTHGIFRSAHLPVPPTLVLPVADMLTIVSAGDYTGLREDFDQLGPVPWVVRMTGNVERDLLPTSPPLSGPDDLTAYLSDTATEWEAEANELAFLLAPLTPCHVSAWVNAFPGSPQVHVDALWGFPDGLLLLPHDTYFARPEKVTSKRQHKGVGVFCEPETGWHLEPIGPKFDWELTLSDDEVEVAARWGRSVADAMGCEIQLMVMARIGGGRGEDSMLPWYYTTHESPPQGSTLHQPPLSRSLPVIHDRDDLRRLASSDSYTNGLRLAPSAEVMRDPDFFREVGATAAASGRIVYFEGSMLGHAFYMLGAAGASVVPIAPPEIIDTREDRKIVRDLIPAVIESAGATPILRNVTPEQALTLLKQKLVEESLEAWESTGESTLEELADVSEVVRAIAQRMQSSIEEVERRRRAKAEKRGGFDNMVFLDRTEFRSAPRLEAPGMLPLTMEDWGSTPTRERRYPLRAVERANGDVEVDLPLVPPVSHGLPVDQLEANAGSWKLVVDYSWSAIHMRVSRREGRPEPPKAVGQTALSIDDEPPGGE